MLFWHYCPLRSAAECLISLCIVLQVGPVVNDVAVGFVEHYEQRDKPPGFSSLFCCTEMSVICCKP